jgi:hypothetical protein
MRGIGSHHFNFTGTAVAGALLRLPAAGARHGIKFGA